MDPSRQQYTFQITKFLHLFSGRSSEPPSVRITGKSFFECTPAPKLFPSHRPPDIPDSDDIQRHNCDKIAVSERKGTKMALLSPFLPSTQYISILVSWMFPLYIIPENIFVVMTLDSERSLILPS